MKRPAPILVALYTWLLPFAVAAGGFGVHYALHVPPGPLPPPSPQKLEDDRKAADKKKREEDRKKKEEDRKAGKKPKVDRSGAREFPYEPFNRAREQYLIDQLWAYYEPEDFKKEPTFDAWQTAHKPLLAQIVQNARQVGLSPAPPISVVGTECHTIRCRFNLTGEQKDLEQIVPVLRDLRLGDVSLWHQFDAGKPGPDKKDAAGRYKVQVTVSLMRDLPELTAIQVPGKGPLAPPRPTSPTSPATHSPTGTVPGAAPSGAPLRTPTGSSSAHQPG